MNSPGTSSNGNRDAIEAWNTILFDKFVRFRTQVSRGLGAHSEAALRMYPVAEGARVLDVGAGFGDTTFDIARAVGPEGHAVGVDAAARFMEDARAAAAAGAVTNVSFLVCDVECDALEGPYDAAFSRMGTMFFASPVAALRNVHRALHPGARFVSIVWRKKVDNAFMHAAEVRVKELLPPPEQSGAVTCGPGPFSMADADTVTDIFHAAGFREVSLTRNDADICIGRDIEDAVEFGMSLGPAGELIRLSGEVGAAKRPLVEQALREVFSSFVRPDGLWAPSSTWIIAARA